MEVGEVMRSAREAVGVSLAEMARRIGYSKPYLGLLETGRKTVRPEHVEAYERALGVRIDPLAHAAAAPRRVDAGALADLAAILSATRRLEDAAGVALVLPTVRGLAAMTQALAREARGEVAPRALSVASEVSQYRGWLEHAAGGEAGAVAALERAIQLGAEAGDPDRLDQGLSFRGYVALARGDVATAADFSAAAARVGGAHPSMKVYNLFQRARVHARAGEMREAQLTLAQADRAAAALTDPPPDAAYWYTDGFWGLQRARVLWALGLEELARAEIRAAIEAVPAEQRGAEWLGRWRRAAAGDAPPGE